MKCPECGKEDLDLDNACFECGEQFTADDIADAAAERAREVLASIECVHCATESEAPQRNDAHRWTHASGSRCHAGHLWVLTTAKLREPKP